MLGVVQESVRPLWANTYSYLGHSCPGCWWTVFGGLHTLYSLLRIQCTDHQIQFTSIIGKSALVWVSVCLERPYWFLNHSKHLHCWCQANPVISLIKDQEMQPQGDVTQDPGLCRCPHCVLFKGGKAVASRILGESETHTSQHEPLPVTPHNIQIQYNYLFYFPLLVSIKGFSQQHGMWEFIQNQRAKTWGCDKLIHNLYLSSRKYRLKEMELVLFQPFRSFCTYNIVLKWLLSKPTIFFPQIILIKSKNKCFNI